MRMTAYGYDFHQTMIAKIEAAQRPLRVRELADFAALYGVEIQDLIYPSARSLPAIDQEIVEVTARLGMTRAQTAAAARELESVRKAMHDAEAAFQVSTAEAAVMEGRLAALRADREKLVSWESGEGSRAEGGGVTEWDAFEPKRIPLAPVVGGSAVARMLAGAQLGRLRKANGVSVEEAAYAIRASRSKIMRLEAGRVRFKERDVHDLLTLYGVTDERERMALIELARRASVPSWWHTYSDILPDWLESYLGLEEAAAQIWAYEMQFVPDLLQTEDYARAVTLLGRGGFPAEDADRGVWLRLGRQAVLDRPDPPDLRVILDESVLRRQVGSPAVIRDQLKHLAELAERPSVTIRMLPFQASGRSTGGSFTILRFAASDVLDTVYFEQLTTALYLDNPQDVESYLGVMQQLDTQSLTARETTRFLQDLLT